MTATTDDPLNSVPIYVADTEERAREEAKAPIESLFNEYLNNPWEMLLPPGYTSLGSTKQMMKARAALGTRPKHQSVDALIESGTALIGSPQTVREKIEKMRDLTGFHNLGQAEKWRRGVRQHTDLPVQRGREVLYASENPADAEFSRAVDRCICR